MIITKDTVLSAVKGNKKKVIAGGIVSLLAAAMLTISGCYVSYHHKVKAGDMVQLEETYHVEFKMDK